MNNSTLYEGYKAAKHKHSGHQDRDVSILKQAFEHMEGDLEADLYGKGPSIRTFEQKMAAYLGKESAVFFPSGTMAQQIALRIWSDEKGINKVAYHPLSHLELHEEDAIKELHHLEPVLLAEKNRLIGLEDIANLEEDISCLLLELPQREIGGQLPSYETLIDLSDYCRDYGIRLHLDGARLLEVLPYYEKTAAEICSLFDSVYLSFYKGVGGIAGAILAGSESFTEKSKVWKRRHGGDLISLYPYFLSADYYFEMRKNKMTEYYHHARELAELYNQCHAVRTMPAEPVTNMFHVHFAVSREELEPLLLEIYETADLGFTGYLAETADGALYYEVSIGDAYEQLPKDVLKKAFQMLDEKMKALDVSRQN